MSAKGNPKTHHEKSALATQDCITFYPPNSQRQVGLISCSAGSIHDKAFILDPINRYAELNSRALTAAADVSLCSENNSDYFKAVYDAYGEEANRGWKIKVAINGTEIPEGIKEGSSFMVLSRDNPTEPCLTHPKFAGQTSELPQPTTAYVPAQASISASSTFPTRAGTQISSGAPTKAMTNERSILSILPIKETGKFRILANAPIPKGSNVERTVSQCREISNAKEIPYNFMTQFSNAMSLSKGKKSKWVIRGEFDAARRRRCWRRDFTRSLPQDPTQRSVSPEKRRTSNQERNCQLSHHQHRLRRLRPSLVPKTASGRRRWVHKGVQNLFWRGKQEGRTTGRAGSKAMRQPWLREHGESI
jgi:hypothetical protein